MTTNFIKDDLAIEIGDEDLSSCYGDSTNGSYTTSLSSSVFDFVYENGRRYASSRSSGKSTAEYLFPNDEKEQERLDLVHHIWGLLFKGELHKAKFDTAAMKEKAAKGEPFRVLDLGTGTGIWAIDFGDAYPSAEVIGVDLSPIQPEWVPPNVRFEVDNVEDEWVYKHKFDYIHIRNLVGSIKDYPSLLKQIYSHLVPGGIVEFQETHITGVFSEDGTITKDSKIVAYEQNLKKAGDILKQPMDITPEIKNYVRDAGFIDINEVTIKAPMGSWPKKPEHREIGLVFQEIVQTGVEAYGLASFTRVLGWDEKKAQEFLAEVLAECNDRKVHKIYPVFVVWGKKPLDTE